MCRSYANFLALFFLLLYPLTITPQNLCSGNLGENIFTEGDFGSGEAGLLLTDPGIAPGYIYFLSNASPDDGYYQIINNTDVWGFKFGTWIDLQDNSDDPYGYMMVVNASFEPGIFFEQTIDDLCENTLYEFSADIINMIATDVTNHIYPDVSFFLDDVLFFTTGPILQTEQWNKYGFLFTTPPGKTTLKLTLRNNAPGGIGNDLALDNISFRPCGPNAFVDAEQTITLCENGTSVPVTADIEGTGNQHFVQWQLSVDEGLNWMDITGANGFNVIHDKFTPGLYTYRYLTAYSTQNLENTKCRVISDQISIEVLPITFEVFDTVCENTAYEFGNEMLFEEGIYTGEFDGRRGCDSIVTLHLTVVPAENIEFSVRTDEPSCHGYNDGFLAILNVRNGTEPYRYFVNGEETAATEITGTPSGDYLVEVFDRYGCTGQMLIFIGEPPPLNATPVPDTSILLGESLHYLIESNFSLRSVSWEGMNTVYCQSCNPVTLLPFQSDEIVVTIQSENGCMARDTFFVNVDLNVPLFIPNVFSPSADIPNNHFTVYSYGQSVTAVREILVYDRWGNRVFHVENISPNEYDSGWDGTSKGRILSVGVYVYLITLEMLDGSVQKHSGTVTLVK